MRRLLAIVVLGGAVAAAIVMTAATSGSPAVGKTYMIEFDNAFGLTEGGDLRIAGVNAGSTDKFTLTTDDPVKAVVTAKLTVPGFSSLRRDAFCEIRQQSLIGEYFVDCQPGKSKEEIPNGGTIPVQQTASTIPIDLVNNILRRPYRERFRLIIGELGAGLAGRPDDLAETLRRAHPGLRETSKTLRLLADQRENIRDFITDGDRVVEELEEQKEEVAGFVKEAGETAEITASRRPELAEGFQKAPRFFNELRPLMQRLGTFADAQVPLLVELRRAAPSLNDFIEELGPFSRASRPAVDSLGEAAVVGRRALAKSEEEIAALRRVAQGLPGLAKPLRQYLESIDDRSRSVYNDSRARTEAPPAPDKTAYKAGQGYTGMEAFWNSLGYAQSLTINRFDEVSHFLNLLVIETDECAPFASSGSIDGRNDGNGPEGEEETKIREDCNSYLGPYQPGVTAPDPTEDGGSSAARARSASAEGDDAEDGGDATASTDRRDRGEPEAKAGANKPDLSKPEIVMPEGAKALVEQVGRARTGLKGAQPDPPAPADRRQAEEQMLDYLMGR